MTQPSFGRVGRRLAGRTRVPFVLSAFTGFNDDLNNQALLDTDLRIAKNLILYRADLIGSRPGTHRDPYGEALNSGGAITFLHDMHAVKDTVQRGIVIAGNKIYVESAGTDPSTVTDITNSLTVTAGANNLFTHASHRDSLIITNGVDVPIQIPSSGNAVALSGWFANGRAAQFVHSQFNYVFFAGFNTSGSPGANQHPMAVFHGELGDANTWLEGNILDRVGGVGSYGDEYVTGLFRHRDFFMVGTNRRIFPVQYTGDTLAKFIIQRPLDVGLASQHSVVSINGEYTFFMDPRGNIHAVHETAQGFGSIGIQSISRKIKNHISNFSRSILKYATSAYLKDLGWCVWSVPFGLGATAKNELLVLDINDFPLDSPDWRIAKFFRWTGISANVLATMQRDTDSVANSSEPAAAGVESLCFGTTTGWVKRFSPNISYDETDAGAAVAISTDMATKYFDFGDPQGEKSVVEVLWNMSPASSDPGPTARIEYDYGVRSSGSRQIFMDANTTSEDVLDTTFVLDTSRLASDTGITSTKDYFREGGVTASLRLQQNVSSDITWRLQRATMLVEMRGDVAETEGGLV